MDSKNIFVPIRKFGFTMIEVLIAILILAVISTLTASSIQRSIKFKSKLDQDIADYSSVRDALVIMTRDINEAFHWIDINAEIKKKLTEDATKAGRAAPFQQPQTNGAAPTPTPAEYITAFIGDAQSIYFTTLSHQRVVTDAAESDQAKVGYFLKDVKSIHDDSSVKALIRSESPVLDGDVAKPGKETVLLENVKTLTFRYMSSSDQTKDHEEWLESWKSVDTDDARMKNNFPDAVEVTIVTSRNNREVKLSTVAAIHMPNNDPFGFKKQAGQGTSPNGQNTQAGQPGATGTGGAGGAGGATGLQLPGGIGH